MLNFVMQKLLADEIGYTQLVPPTPCGFKFRVISII